MNWAAFQYWSQILILMGTVLLALGGFGSWYFGKLVQDAKDVESRAREEQLHTRIDELMGQSKSLETQLEPFRDLAKREFPNLDTEEALGELRGEIDRVREIAAKHEFRPLDSDIRRTLVADLKTLSSSFTEAGAHIEITYETWAVAPTREFASQLAELLREAGFDARGPKTATVYLAQQAYAVEWGFNGAQQALVDRLYGILRRAILPGPSAGKRTNLPKGRVRIHFGGAATFNENGIVTME